MIEVSQFVAYARFRAILVQKGYACVMWGGAATTAVHNRFLPRFVGAFPRAAEPFWWLRRCVQLCWPPVCFAGTQGNVGIMTSSKLLSSQIMSQHHTISPPLHNHPANVVSVCRIYALHCLYRCCICIAALCLCCSSRLCVCPVTVAIYVHVHRYRIHGHTRAPALSP